MTTKAHDPRQAKHAVTVLFLDADATWLQRIGHYMSPFFEVLTATDESSALRTIAGRRLDVVVSDSHFGIRTAALLQSVISKLAPGLEQRMVFTTCGGFDEAQHDFFARTESPVVYRYDDFAMLRGAIDSLAF